MLASFSPTRTQPGAPRWIVCEQTGRWAVGLRRDARASGLRLYETRSLADAWEMLQQHPSSFVVAELTRSNPPALLHRMAWLEHEFPLARVAVVADRSLADWQWLMREAGAVWFCSSPWQVGPIVAMARRHLQLVPVPPRSLAEQLWHDLPWPPNEATSACPGTMHLHDPQAH